MRQDDWITLLYYEQYIWKDIELLGIQFSTFSIGQTIKDTFVCLAYFNFHFLMGMYSGGEMITDMIKM